MFTGRVKIAFPILALGFQTSTRSYLIHVFLNTPSFVEDINKMFDLHETVEDTMFMHKHGAKKTKVGLLLFTTDDLLKTY